jgi:hypothetical protein
MIEIQRRVTASSSNGVVSIVNAAGTPMVMKSLRAKTRPKKIADNLAYELFVGNFLNAYVDRFPCFIKTYGAYRLHKPLTDTQTALSADDMIPLTDDDVCTRYKNIVLFIEYVPAAMTMHKFVEQHPSDVVKALFQVYMPLAAMATEFTHSDLHMNNVMVYEPFPGKCIHFHYHLPGRVVKFKTSFLVKIIDYGKCYVKSNKVFFKRFTCKAGFNCYKNVTSASTNTCKQRNVSSDLRLLRQVQDRLSLPFPILYDQVDNPSYHQHYGTAQAKDNYPPRVQTVRDAAKALELLVKDDLRPTHRTLHVYLQGPYSLTQKG